jgi:hypothetical protein
MLKKNEGAFLIQVITIFLSFFLLVCTVVMWLTDYNVIYPVRSLTDTVDRLYTMEGTQAKLDADVKAYKVGVITAEEAKLQRLKGTVRGGVPFILYGEPGDYTLTLASSSAVVPGGNQLVGTLAPTFVSQTEGDNTHFGLSAANGDFRKIKDAGMIVPSNKAYLPIPTRLLTDEARFAIVFEEKDSPSMVQDVTVCNDTDMSVYNLNGQRVSHPCKGLFVKNGRKVHIR